MNSRTIRCSRLGWQAGDAWVSLVSAGPAVERGRSQERRWSSPPNPEPRFPPMSLARRWPLAAKRMAEPEEVGSLLRSSGACFQDESIERCIGAPIGDSPSIDAGGSGGLWKGGTLVGDLAEHNTLAPGKSGECGGEVVHGRSVWSEGEKVHEVLATAAANRER